ncbi:MAG: hypothetical protein IKI42_06070 [Clostridia bacterium]|nr:hypothetical protein [Clostridia bacterium]
MKGTFYGVLFIWGRVKKFFNKTEYFRFFCVHLSEGAEKAYPAASVTPVSLRQRRSYHKCETHNIAGTVNRDNKTAPVKLLPHTDTAAV